MVGNISRVSLPERTPCLFIVLATILQHNGRRDLELFLPRQTCTEQLWGKMQFFHK